MIGVTVNGTEHYFESELTMRGLLAQLGMPERGIAVAVNGGTLARDHWDEPVQRGWVIDVLTAVQGG
ncbi:sulfur carrier protein ThiS [Skermania piniformis]